MSLDPEYGGCYQLRINIRWEIMENESKAGPLVGVVMGSKSDFPVMKDAVEVLQEFDISAEVRVVSAHRTPADMATYGKEAEKRGIKVIIAGAGGAAHLPGMLASYSSLPVIGVPVKSSSLSGLDSLLSIVQMPKGVPVATVAINGARNAGLLAVQILATSNDVLARKMHEYKERIANESRSHTEELEGS